VRRQSKKSNKALKVLTAAAVVAAMSTGSLTAFASTDRQILVDTGAGVRSFTIEQLSDKTYRDIVINAFNNSNPILVQQDDDTWNEISENANFDVGIENALEDYEPDEDSPFKAYME